VKLEQAGLIPANSYKNGFSEEKPEDGVP